MPSRLRLIWFLSLFVFPLFLSAQITNVNIDDIILDIYHAATELCETDYEQLQSDLYALHQTPINLNATSDEELSQLPFLSPQQIDDILAYADRHPFESLYELRLIPSLKDYDIRDLLPFVTLGASQKQKTYIREVFHFAKHEIITRVDARNIEAFEGTDPIFFQTRYRFDYQRRVQFGLHLKRPAGGKAQDLQYSGFLQLRDIGPMHTIVAGNFQAAFGQGLVLAPVFHTGKNAYIQSIGTQQHGLRYYSSTDGAGLQGLGATFRHTFNKSTRLDVSALYSLKRANDSTLHHLIGANITLRYHKLQVELTTIENIWSDSIRPYRNTTYNQHYFRGTNQAVLGAAVRYNYGWFDVFAELATAQNHEINNPQSTINNPQSLPSLQGGAGGRLSHWGFAAIAGSRFYPTSGLSLIALYRYYSPYFDNALGYAFSETSRIGDEQGGYIGFDLTRWNHWRLSGYVDVFHFSGPKYGIPTYPSWGYDAMLETKYHARTSNRKSRITNDQSGVGSPWFLVLRLRARTKASLSTYSTRFQFDYQLSSWSFRTTAEANLTAEPNLTNDKSQITNDKSPIHNQQSQIHNPQPLPSLQGGVGGRLFSLGYGFTLYQDIAYNISLGKFSRGSAHPSLQGRDGERLLSFRLRLQFFDAREWNNRIYTYEHDVLYAFSIPAIYGLGGRAYLSVRCQIIPQLALYLRVSETIYARDWYASKHPNWPQSTTPQSALPTRTDIHLLLRATL